MRSKNAKSEKGIRTKSRYPLESRKSAPDYSVSVVKKKNLLIKRN